MGDPAVILDHTACPSVGALYKKLANPVHRTHTRRMVNRWSGVTIDCADPARMSRFWGRLLGLEPTNEHGDDAGWATLGSRSGPTPRLTFQRVPEPKSTKARIHLDIEVDDIDTGRARVESLGGRWTGVRHDHDEGVVLNMQDPEGHEFCLVQYHETSGARS